MNSSPARPYKELRVLQRPLPFSYWPMAQGPQTERLQSTLFSADPWPIIISQTRRKCPSRSKVEALALLEQSQDYFRAAASSEISAARPLILYYGYMNLVKAFLLVKGRQTTYDKARHGVTEHLDATGHRKKELLNAFLKSRASTSSNINVFDDFYAEVTGSRLADNSRFDLVKLMPQIVPGHRLWTAASARKERFIAINQVEFAQELDTERIWLNIVLTTGDLTRLRCTTTDLIVLSGLGHNWEVVQGPGSPNEPDFLTVEQKQTLPFSGSPSKEVFQLISSVRQNLWRTVSITPPYRKYYLYLCPKSERGHILPQLLSMYAIMFYLGSITRYRPQHFDSIIQTKYGSFIQAFLGHQPTQFLFLMASEFAAQEVTKPALT